MIFPLWLKIWLGILSFPVFIGFFPFILMYFKVKGKPMWELPLWQENKVANYLIPLPKGGYSRETWVAIKPQPILFFLKTGRCVVTTLSGRRIHSVQMTGRLCFFRLRICAERLRALL